MTLVSHFRSLALPAVLLAAVFLTAACSRSASSSADKAPGGHDHGEHDHAHRHEHKPPHGGAAVVLGDELYHLEVVLDQTTGFVQAYVMDAEFENFVRCSAPALRLRIQSGLSVEVLTLKPVANPITGETEQATSLFEGKAEWLKGRASFDAELEEIIVSGTRFAGVKFKYPKGNDED